MNSGGPQTLDIVGCGQVGKPDRAFVAFASPEPRCLGAANRFSDYRAGIFCLLRIEDEDNQDRANNVRILHDRFTACGKVVDCPMRHSDPIFGISGLLSAIIASEPADGVVSLDVSTFPRNSLLLVLRALANVVAPERIRLLYTEPSGYNLQSYEPLSYGLRRIAAVPTFSAPYRAEEELVLVMFLGFERDRVLGLWQCVAPHRTIAVIGEPPYRSEWRGVSEYINAAILAGLPENCVRRVDPRDPLATYALLKELLIDPRPAPAENFYIAPFGTKPQTIGIGCFCRDYARAATVVYAAPVASNQDYITQGVGSTWILPMPVTGDYP